MMQTTLRKIRGARPCGMHLENDRRIGYFKSRHGFGHIWRPADVPTNGVDAAIDAAKGGADGIR